jgi:hypothetical protein
MLAPQQPQRTAARDVSVERHLARHTRERRRESLSKECLRSGDPPVASEQEIDGLAILVDSTMEIVPLGERRASVLFCFAAAEESVS